MGLLKNLWNEMTYGPNFNSGRGMGPSTQVPITGLWESDTSTIQSFIEEEGDDTESMVTDAVPIQYFITRPVPPETIIDNLLDPDIPVGYFRTVIGQKKVLRRLRRVAGKALRREDHLCDQNILFEGPSSAGKTHLARVFASNVLLLPILELDATWLANQKFPKAEILFGIAKTLLAWDKDWRNRGGGKGDPVGLTLVELENKMFYPPPMVIFIDEAHKLPKQVQDALLKATERNDRLLLTENGYTVNCGRICWILATTRRGELREEFDNRFKKIRLKLYTKDEIAQIIQLNYPQWSKEECDLVAHYAPRVPREAKDFAEEVADELDQHPDLSFAKAAATVADDAEIDKYGMTYQRLDILKALGQEGPMSLKRLCGVAQCDEETLKERVLPAMLATLPGEPALMSVTHRHFITPAGLHELDKRGIKHLGKKALPRDFVEMSTEEN